MKTNDNGKDGSPNGAGSEEPTVRESLEQVLREMASSIKKPPLQMKKDADAVVKKLVRLRDHLITDQRSREDDSFSQSPVLEQVNIALSLVISVGYPGGTIQRQALEEAHGLLQDFLRK